MLGTAVTIFLILYIVSVIGCYRSLGDERNDRAFRQVLSLVHINTLRPFHKKNILLFFIVPWIPIINSFLTIEAYRLVFLRRTERHM